jgi:uncharacterized protein (TIGR03435 family)
MISVKCAPASEDIVRVCVSPTLQSKNTTVATKKYRTNGPPKAHILRNRRHIVKSVTDHTNRFRSNGYSLRPLTLKLALPSARIHPAAEGGLMLRFGLVLAFVSTSVIASAQLGTPLVAFDVASVKRGSPRDPANPFPVTAGEFSPGGRWSAQNATLLLILQATYSLPAERIVGGPSWLDTQLFDISAKAAGDAPREQIVLMVKQLLADRFRYQAHLEGRQMAVFALVPVRGDGQLGPGLRPNTNCDLPADAREENAVPPKLGAAAPPRCGLARITRVNGVNHLQAVGQTIQVMLAVTSAKYALGLLIVDRTGLTGRFDIDLDYVPQSVAMASGQTASTGPMLVTAIQEQLGLKFERREEMLDVLVIDHAEMPTPD